MRFTEEGERSGDVTDAPADAGYAFPSRGPVGRRSARPSRGGSSAVDSLSPFIHANPLLHAQGQDTLAPWRILRIFLTSSLVSFITIGGFVAALFTVHNPISTSSPALDLLHAGPDPSIGVAELGFSDVSISWDEENGKRILTIQGFIKGFTRMMQGSLEIPMALLNKDGNKIHGWTAHAQHDPDNPPNDPRVTFSTMLRAPPPEAHAVRLHLPRP